MHKVTSLCYQVNTLICEFIFICYNTFSMKFHSTFSTNEILTFRDSDELVSTRAYKNTELLYIKGYVRCIQENIIY